MVKRIRGEKKKAQGCNRITVTGTYRALVERDFFLTTDMINCFIGLFQAPKVIFPPIKKST